MIFSLRPLLRSPRLRALAALAWLMLVINAAAAMPSAAVVSVAPAQTLGSTVAMGSGHTHAPMAAVDADIAGSDLGAVDHAGVEQPDHGSMHAGMADTGSAHCCDTVVTHSCACAAMCAVAMTPVAMAIPASPVITQAYALPVRVNAPLPMTAPPLRPPAA